MKIFNSLDELGQIIPNAHLALGAFDGIHLGHKKIIERTVNSARQKGGVSVVFTFSNHPSAVLGRTKCPPQIVSRAVKEQLIAGLGVDVLCNVPFTQELAKLSADGFINLLKQKFGLRQIIIGENYRYGYQARGDTASLQRAGGELDFLVERVALATITDPLTLGEITISSSVIREFLKAGKISAAAFLLGRSFSLSGTVGNGAKRGRELGYPTANIVWDSKLIIPADGVYAANIFLGQAGYKGVVNIGVNPTFNCRERTLEAHLLDFTGNLYGETLTIDFIWRIRSEMKFANGEELKTQIAKDAQEAKFVLANL
ncbi:MAG: bifunctional riboflavin kinase/FAD synthetase [Sporomusaceae bacterium]|jgi:riboflavin kinase/FMN adenylyltransferase|nr:bifunctional riboflavin kinase/FAD synthetase [Sporomusaceae bacterium]